MNEYHPIYVTLLEKAGIERTALDPPLQELIRKFDKAFSAMKLERTRRPELLTILIQVDAIISANISRLYQVLPDKTQKPTREPAKVDKMKVMALRAKALQLKWKTNQALNVAV